MASVYPRQRYVISNTLEGRSQIVVLPTGSGKSLCFQLPSQLLSGITLVLVPILSLLSDQVRRLEGSSIPVGVLRGGQDDDERRTLGRRLRTEGLRIVYATPEVMLTRGARDLMRGIAVANLVVDEAHCVCEWGETFRPAYLEMGAVARQLAPRALTAFTATGSPDVLARVRSILFGEGEVLVFTANPDRPNISYEVLPVLCKDHELERLAREAKRPLIVFGRSRKGVERSARLLRRRLGDREVRFYHAGLDREERRAVEEWFLPSRSGILTATSAFGMGVDKPDIRTVIHADLPPSPEAYLQESGRAGRDGEPARAILLWSREDERFAGSLEDEVPRRRIGQMLSYAGGSGVCRRVTLLGFMGAEAESCGGCDVCAGSLTGEPPGEAAMVEALSRQRRRFDAAQAAHFLCGGRSYAVQELGLDRWEGFGALEGWLRDDVESALGELLLAGAVRMIRRGPWKGKLTVPRSPSTSPVWRHGGRRDDQAFWYSLALRQRPQMRTRRVTPSRVRRFVCRLTWKMRLVCGLFLRPTPPFFLATPLTGLFLPTIVPRPHMSHVLPMGILCSES